MSGREVSGKPARSFRAIGGFECDRKGTTGKQGLGKSPSIPIRLKRRIKVESVQPFRSSKNGSEAAALREELAAWGDVGGKDQHARRNGTSRATAAYDAHGWRVATKVAVK
jgi:hypothetical protein